MTPVKDNGANVNSFPSCHGYHPMLDSREFLYAEAVGNQTYCSSHAGRRSVPAG